MSIPNSYNPSDYEYLLRSLTEGSQVAKAEALKRFQILAGSDRKQFAVYAKRIILAIQDLVAEPKQQINLHASMLVLQIVNVNPKDIEYYIRTKALKKIVINLGDSKPQLRKTSHYCLLAYLKTYKNIDETLSNYTQHGINSSEPQLRQKAINSLQSIIITDPKSLNWNSGEFKKTFQLLIQKLRDHSPFVQKAAEQCLLTLSRMNQIHSFSKKLAPSYAGLYKAFCDAQRQLGNLQAVNIIDQIPLRDPEVSLHKAPFKLEKSISQYSIDKSTLSKQDAINKQALIQKIEELRKNSKTPLNTNNSIKQKSEEKKSARLPPALSQRSLVRISQRRQNSPEKEDNKVQKGVHPVIFATKGGIQNAFGKQLFQNLRNEKDWKVRLEAVQELAAKFQMYKQSIDPETLAKNLIPLMIKLLSDPNFKISTLTLKLFQQILRVPQLSLETVAPRIVQKLGDGKVVLRQGIARLIRSQYLRQYNPIWIQQLLQLLNSTLNPVLRQEILGILSRLYEDQIIKYPFDKIVESVCPLMDDPKTKIKIKTLDLLVKITISTQKVDAIKSILSSKLNQVYYEMFVEKVNTDLKNRITPRLAESEPPPRGQNRSLSFPSLRKHNKSNHLFTRDSANNTTQTSLPKYGKTTETRTIPRATSELSSKEDFSYHTPHKTDVEEEVEIKPRGSYTPHETVRKKPIKSYKRKMQKTIESKLALTQTVDSEGLRPVQDPQKEVKGILADLKSENWQACFDGLTKLRRIIKHHSEFLTPTIGRSLASETAKLVESLRSSLSKNAVICLGQIVQVLGRSLDPELDGIYSRLMRKTLDANSFISQQVRKTLILASMNCNEAKVLSILVNYHSSRAIPIKINIISILEIMGGSSKIVEKQYQKLVSILVAFMGEGALQIRERSKTLLSKLLTEDRHDKIAKIVPPDILKKIRKVDHTHIMSSKIVKEPIVVPQIIRQSSLSPSKRTQLSPLKKKKILTFPKEFEQIQQLLLSCQITQWKARQAALSSLASIAKIYPQEISQHRFNTRVIQMFAKQSNDPNSKVATSALTHFMQLAPLIPKLVQSNLSVICNELFSSFASQKAQVRELSLLLFDHISQKVQNWMLIQHLCNGVLYGHAKAKSNILVKIIKVLPTAMREKKVNVQKHIYSLINKLSEQSKGDTTPILKQLINMTISLGGQEAVSALKQSAKNLIPT